MLALSLLLALPVVGSLIVPNHLSVITAAVDPFSDPAVWGTAAVAAPDCAAATCAAAASGSDQLVAGLAFYFVGMTALTAW